MNAADEVTCALTLSKRVTALTALTPLTGSQMTPSNRHPSPLKAISRGIRLSVR